MPLFGSRQRNGVGIKWAFAYTLGEYDIKFLERVCRHMRHPLTIDFEEARFVVCQIRTEHFRFVGVIKALHPMALLPQAPSKWTLETSTFSRFPQG